MSAFPVFFSAAVLRVSSPRLALSYNLPYDNAHIRPLNPQNIMKKNILISACLVGLKVRYNGQEKQDLRNTLSLWQAEHRLVIHCPELAAGLPCPRPAAEIVGGNGDDVLDGRAVIIENTGQDVTQHYLLAAWLALNAARAHDCGFALLTDGSPTCGSRTIYDGTFTGQQRPGPGVAAALLRRHGIQVFSEKQLPALIDQVRLADGVSLPGL